MVDERVLAHHVLKLVAKAAGVHFLHKLVVAADLLFHKQLADLAGGHALVNGHADHLAGDVGVAQAYKYLVVAEVGIQLVGAGLQRAVLLLYVGVKLKGERLVYHARLVEYFRYVGKARTLRDSHLNLAPRLVEADKVVYAVYAIYGQPAGQRQSAY